MGYMNRQEVIGKIASHLTYLKERYHVGEIGIFGSVARGEDTAESDVDILVEFTSPIGLFDFLRLEKYLSEILGRKVDLVSRKGVKPAIRDEVLKDAVYV